MTSYLQVLALAALPAFGNLFGGLMAELLPVSRRTLSLSLHAAAGIVLAVVGIELMPEALQSKELAWVTISFFVAGGVAFVGLDEAIDFIRCRMGNSGSTGSTSWGIFIGVFVDLFTDGLLIGTGSTISFGLALALAIGQVSADIPEGFATIATFKKQGMQRLYRVLVAVSFGIPVFLGASIGYFAVREAPEIYKLCLLTFSAGILLAVVIEEIVPEAHADKDSKWAVLCLVIGFSLFSLLSVYLEV